MNLPSADLYDIRDASELFGEKPGDTARGVALTKTVIRYIHGIVSRFNRDDCLGEAVQLLRNDMLGEAERSLRSIGVTLESAVQSPEQRARIEAGFDAYREASLAICPQARFHDFRDDPMTAKMGNPSFLGRHPHEFRSIYAEPSTEEERRYAKIVIGFLLMLLEAAYEEVSEEASVGIATTVFMSKIILGGSFWDGGVMLRACYERSRMEGEKMMDIAAKYLATYETGSPSERLADARAMHGKLVERTASTVDRVSTWMMSSDEILQVANMLAIGSKDMTDLTSRVQPIWLIESKVHAYREVLEEYRRASVEFMKLAHVMDGGNVDHEDLVNAVMRARDVLVANHRTNRIIGEVLTDDGMVQMMRLQVEAMGIDGGDAVPVSRSEIPFSNG